MSRAPITIARNEDAYERRRRAYADLPSATNVATLAGFRITNHGPNCFRLEKLGKGLIATYRPLEETISLAVWVEQHIKKAGIR